ncbi:MAG: DUF2958 domain-containing protein [Planctomycetota bacterium]
MNLFTKSQFEQLLANGRNRDADHFPVVKLFTPDAGCTWLIAEIDPENPDIAFGLCDLGQGYPELGSVSISELCRLRGSLGLPVERDQAFSAAYPLSVYLAAAREAGRITEFHVDLKHAAAERDAWGS